MPMKAAIIPVTPLQQNCTLVWCTETMEGALIDPGGDNERLMDEVKKHGVKLVKLLVTHGHLDHAGGTAEIAETQDLPIEGPHKEDLFLINDLEKDAAKWGFSGPKPFTPTRWLEDGDEVSFGNVTMQVIHCPGHTPGHVVFFEPELKIAQVGDVIFQGSIGRTDFPRGDHAELINSITKKLWPLGNDVTFIPGHGPISTFGQERQMNGFVADHLLK